MPWDSSAPKTEELNATSVKWDSAPPTNIELGIKDQVRNDNGSDVSQYVQEGDTLSGEQPYSLSPQTAFKVLETIDKYTGAPIRKFITEKVSGQNLEKAPTGKEQAAMMGLSTDEYGIPGIDSISVSPAGVAGVGLEVLQDPLLIGGLAIKGAKGLKAGVNTLLSGEQLTKSSANASAMAGANAEARSAAGVAQEAAQLGNSKAGVNSNITLGGGEQSVKTQFSPFEVKPPQSLKELESWKPPQNLGKMQSQRRLGEIEKIVPDLEVKPLRYHYDMLENPKSMRALKNTFENLTSPQKYQVASYNLSMLDDAQRKAVDTIESISKTPIRDVPDQGTVLINQVKDRYKNQKEVLKPYFEKLKKVGPIDKNSISDLKIAIAQNTKVSSLLSQDELGNVILKPNTTKTGLSDAEYRAIKRIFNDLDGKVTFQEMQKMRDYLRKQIDPMNPAMTEELQKVRSVLLDKLEDIGEKKVPQMREVFKRYAINERAVDDIEDIIGGKIETLNSMYAANPDKIINKVLSNPNYQEIVKGYIGPDAYSEMLASYVWQGFKNSIDQVKGFAPEKFRNFLKKNENVLSRSLGQEQFSRLSALADHGYLARRFLDEVNMSGTAESILSALKPGSFTQEILQKGPVAATKQQIYSSVLNKQKQSQAAKVMNEALAGSNANASANSSSSMAQKIYNNVRENYPKALDKFSVANLAKFQAGASTGRGALQGLSSDSENKKGKEKWANDGFNKLMEHSSSLPFKSKLENNKDQLLKDPKNKDLLVQASDLKPGSKAMDRILAQLEKRIASNERQK